MASKTGLIYFPSTDHKNIWDKNFPECPERAEQVYKRLKELNLIQRCIEVTKNSSINIDALIERYYKKEVLDTLKKACTRNQKHEAEQLYDSVYYNGLKTIECAKQSALCCVTLVTDVIRGQLSNGFAVVRPPGHHAGPEPNGYCIFNNVVLCANYIFDNKLAGKILIVDFDVHHGQGTQNAFYDSDKVMYFSIHRYEHGLYWPHLKESHSSYIGSGPGRGYNINVPLNENGLGDTEYLAITLNILIPLLNGFSPDIILVSAGYDSSIGCPKGEMKVTPAFYGHLISILKEYASGKVVCILEGGYFIDSLSEGVVMSLKALLGDPCVSLKLHKTINRSVIDSINDVKFYLNDIWFRCNISDKIPYRDDINCYNEHIVVRRFYEVKNEPPYIMNDTSMQIRYNENVFRETISSLRLLYSKKNIFDGTLQNVDNINDSIYAKLLNILGFKNNINENFVMFYETHKLSFNKFDFANQMLSKNEKRIVIIDFNANEIEYKSTFKRNEVLYFNICNQNSQTNNNFITIPIDNNDLFLIWYKLLLPIVYTYNPDSIIVNLDFHINENIKYFQNNDFGRAIQLLGNISKVAVIAEGIDNVKLDSCSIKNEEKCVSIDKYLADLQGLKNLVTKLKLLWLVLEVDKKILKEEFTLEQYVGLNNV